MFEVCCVNCIVQSLKYISHGGAYLVHIHSISDCGEGAVSKLRTQNKAYLVPKSREIKSVTLQM